ncbi:MAG TPA: hypothetical protein VGX25_20245 [Actinophytocola sp.]|uniref:hypothetical protein n=1 Tax=Actinophytocola sp. TaxID=1872138 RepID=UPI002DDD7816|nr:hypothetical protein [Actinophytocola sp.]HEV2781722.1 hypothetical protein [Actinophytocola sp.]
MLVRRRTTALLSALAVLLAGLAVPAAADVRRTPADCAAALDCTAADIDLMTMAERLELVRGMQAGPAAALGATDRWRNIEGVITFFRDHSLGPSGSWVSYVDAGIVEGIERGIAIALGWSSDTFGNPGSALWASYLTRLSTGALGTRSAHDRAWSEAEQASTEHGDALAAAHGQHATPVEWRFYQFSEVYRWALRNRPVVLDLLAVYGPLIHPALARLRVPFYDWFTDVSRSAPSYKGCEMAYGFAQLHPIAGVVGVAGLFLAYVAELFDEYLVDTSD